MPNIKSQKDRVKTNAKETARNRAIRSNLRTALKKAEAAIAVEGTDKAAVVREASSVIDVAARKGVIHKNAADRRKAAIAKKANA